MTDGLVLLAAPMWLAFVIAFAGRIGWELGGAYWRSMRRR